MADLLDIAPATQSEAVWIGDKRLTVHALPPNSIASIIVRFPELKSIAAGGGDDIVLNLIRFCGNAIGPIIAAGCGHLEDEAYELAATNISLEQQAKLLAAIWRVTFPNGISSFGAAMTTLINAMFGTGEGAKPIKIRSRNILKTSRLPSSLSAGEPESHQTMQ
jgi:hypothetical protein